MACSLISFYYEHFLAPLQATFYKGWYQRFVTRFSVILTASQCRRHDGKHAQLGPIRRVLKSRLASSRMRSIMKGRFRHTLPNDAGVFTQPGTIAAILGWQLLGETCHSWSEARGHVQSTGTLDSMSKAI